MKSRQRVFYDDAQALQREYDKEVEEYTKKKQKELVEERRLEAERRIRQWRHELTVRHKEEEEELIGQDVQIQWLHSIQGMIPQQQGHKLDMFCHLQSVPSCGV